MAFYWAQAASCPLAWLQNRAATNFSDWEPPQKNTPAKKASQVPRFVQLTLHKLSPTAPSLASPVHSAGDPRKCGAPSVHWPQGLVKDCFDIFQSESVLKVLLLWILGCRLTQDSPIASAREVVYLFGEACFYMYNPGGKRKYSLLLMRVRKPFQEIRY